MLVCLSKVAQSDLEPNDGQIMYRGVWSDAEMNDPCANQNTIWLPPHCIVDLAAPHSKAAPQTKMTGLTSRSIH